MTSCKENFRPKTIITNTPAFKNFKQTCFANTQYTRSFIRIVGSAFAYLCKVRFKIVYVHTDKAMANNPVRYFINAANFKCCNIDFLVNILYNINKRRRDNVTLNYTTTAKVYRKTTTRKYSGLRYYFIDVYVRSRTNYQFSYSSKSSSVYRVCGVVDNSYNGKCCSYILCFKAVKHLHLVLLPK